MMRLSLLLLVLCGPLNLMAMVHPDCDTHAVIMNLHRVCKSYSNLKRSTPDLNQGGYWNRDIGGRRPFGWGQFPETPGWGMYPYPQPAPTPRRVNDEYPVEWLFDPLGNDGGENQLPLERWRRDKTTREEIRRFIAEKCCKSGCPFPDDYIKLDKRINMC